MAKKTKPNVNPTTEAKPNGDEKQVPNYANVIPDKLAIIKQYQIEKDYATKVRQVKINNWLKNEELYNGVTQRTLMTRSNLHIPIVFEGVQNASAKVGAVPELSFDTVPEGDENAGDIMTHVVKEDLEDSVFDIVWENSKIECGIYGETVFEVIPGNDKNKVELVDTLAYLRSPIAKNSKNALYQGRQFIYKTYEQIEADSVEGKYDMEEVHKLKEYKIPNETEQTNNTEASVKNIRLANMGLSNTTQFGSKVAELTKWQTYIKGKLHQLLVAQDLYLLQCIPIEDLGTDRPTFVYYGLYSRGIAMLAPSIADIYRDPNLAINVITNQGIDNNTYRNFGEIFVASGSGLKQSSIVPRPNGVTPVNVGPNEKISDKVWIKEVPEITQGQGLSQTIKGYADSAAGMAPPALAQKGKLSVTQQAAMNAQLEQKTTIMKRRATLAFQELCQLMSDITAKKLTVPREVKIFGYKDLTLQDVTHKNFKDVKLIAKALPAEDSQQNKSIKQKAMLDIYELFKDDPKVPGQTNLRRSVTRKFDIEADEAESWFTEDKETEMPAVATPGSDPNAQPNNATQNNGKAQTDATPLISATAKTAAAEVPPKL